MAYRQSNPDALPAYAPPPAAAVLRTDRPLSSHAEPEEAAQIMSGNYDAPPPRQQQQQHGPPYQDQRFQNYNKPQSPRYSPHAQQNAYAAPPQAGTAYGQRPPPVSRVPPTPAPAQGADPTLAPLFKAVDKDGSGQLSERELRAALVNGDWTSFDPHTVRMMIR